MNQPPERIRVTGPPRRRSAPPRAARTREIDAGTAVGAVYMGSLLREQRRLAGRVLFAIAATLGLLPLVFHLSPRVAGVSLMGVPLAWLLLALGVYPFLLLVGWWFVRRAEANERDFVDLLEEVER